MPPDKSIAHRSVMFASIADGLSEIRNFSEAADPQSTLLCLRKLGVEIEIADRGSLKIKGAGRSGFSQPRSDLDCGNSGTTMRLMSGILAGAGVPCVLTGDASLSSRTMKRIITPLKQMGADISARENTYAPIKIGPNSGIKALRFPLPIPSAQLKSCVLLAGLFGDEKTIVIETEISRDHTERLLGLPVDIFGTERRITSDRNHTIPPQNYSIPGDFSAASFWLAAGAVHPSAKIRLQSTGINPSRTAYLSILQQMGAEIEIQNERTEGKEPVADIRVKSSGLKSTDLPGHLVSNCIDEIPVLMVVMCFADGISTIRGAGELRHKETDRLAAMQNVLSKAGARFEIKDDTVTIEGNPGFIPKAAEYESEHDHRIAMSAGVMSLMAQKESIIKNSECTDISYPGFWHDLDRLSAG